MSEFTFFENQTSNATSSPYNVEDGGFLLLKASGTFDGATITMELDFADDDYANIQSYSFTAPDVAVVQPLKNGCRIKAVLASAGASTDITLKSI